MTRNNIPLPKYNNDNSIPLSRLLDRFNDYDKYTHNWNVKCKIFVDFQTLQKIFLKIATVTIVTNVCLTAITIKYCKKNVEIFDIASTDESAVVYLLTFNNVRFEVIMIGLNIKNMLAKWSQLNRNAPDLKLSSVVCIDAICFVFYLFFYFAFFSIISTRHRWQINKNKNSLDITSSGFTS